MTGWRKRQVVDMAREAGLLPCQGIHPKDLEAFANLVRADEREACAKEVENALYGQEGCGKAAEAIRTRGQA